MAISRLDSLYRTLVAEHSRNPHHQGSLPGIEPIQLNNPTCGDVIQLFLLVDGEGRIADISFINSGCSISTASASMMTDIVIGKKEEEVATLAQDFSDLVQGLDLSSTDQLGDAAFLSGVAKFPQRVKCATLAWNALKKAMELNEKKGK
ncbi:MULTISPECIES: Fe-S cluster assembly sulfur transfer protein SufU [unclassified Streptococcus]|uniref:Fe-S cluster assembly sulfur transfer protein SufU n=1 Tax=unclassified Streptococcus TaxID=2608887 RepID=UPI001071B00D|nr:MULTISPECIES: SUF system NifU family Fe-S cluster assembly protein [unclassified Streptococcus]MBF0805795.1 SUF system NifU family Fe-S cluster assembly protein [Streptococcus sp. 19428wA2_WM07]TFU28645.1 SUF system NifU family Fe-S cluster assembly protein [Streptococcus sp. WM07]